MIVKAYSKQQLDWNSKGNQRIAQNVMNILNTIKYEVAYDRTFGISPELIDKPSDYTIPQLHLEIKEQISRYEPRAIVKEIIIAPTVEGDLNVEVILEI